MTRRRAHLRRKLLCLAPAILLLSVALSASTAGTAVAAKADSTAEEQVRRTVNQYLESRCQSLVALRAPSLTGFLEPTDETAVAEAWDDLQVAIAREVECEWADYVLTPRFTEVQVTRDSAHLTVQVDIDYHYRRAPEIDSGIYNAVHRFSLKKTGAGWRIVGIDRDDPEYRYFEQGVANATVETGVSKRVAAGKLKEQRAAELPELARQLKSPVQASLTAVAPPAEGSVVALAAAYGYSASNGSSYAQRFAPVPAGSGRFFYTAPGNDCTNFVSQCVWAGYGGYVSGNDTATRSNIANKVRMVPNIWHGGTGGGMPNWEQVISFWNYAISAKTYGPKATGYNNGGKYTGIYPYSVNVGNVLQVSSGSPTNYGHSVYVSVVQGGYALYWSQVWVCQHSSEWKNRPADNLIASWGSANCYMRRLAFSTATFAQ